MKVLGIIARGGFGRVERVQFSDGQVEARKVFDPSPGVIQPTDVAKFQKRFEREVKVQSQLNAELFIPITRTGLNANPPWFAMPIADRNFRVKIDESKGKGVIPKKALGQILDSLEELHSLGFVHRDLKPQNVLRHADRWKLSDLGLVLVPKGETTKLTSTDSAWGTQEYCAPEQVVGFRSVGPATDIYAFGCILHDVFGNSQRVPFQKQTAGGPIGRIIEKCTESDPRKRFRDVAALRVALSTFLAEKRSLPPPSPGAAEWATALDAIKGWDVTKFEEFADFLRQERSESDLEAVLSIIDEAKCRALHALDADTWKTVALRLCEWARGSFDFNFCDVLIQRLEVVFEIGDLECKASSAVSAAHLARFHHRYFVMRRVLILCGEALDDRVAERIAIEIVVDGAEGDFEACATVLGRDISDFHSRIATVLNRRK